MAAPHRCVGAASVDWKFARFAVCSGLCARLIYFFVHRFDVLKAQFLSTVCTDHCALAFID